MHSLMHYAAFFEAYPFARRAAAVLSDRDRRFGCLLVDHTPGLCRCVAGG